ncbi:OmpP1/FadL family transporter [Antarctobacter jejuensis]|uniref:OmpP1/FadL family transporter n=1 Tax=Antarctobacter jejuensis TaxID=1439938 RepID=UPI003FD40182
MRMTAAALALVGSQATAGGLDTTGQPIAFLFQQGSVAELGFGIINAGISGRDAITYGGSPTGDTAPKITTPFLSYKQDVTDRLSLGVRLEQPFGAEISYPIPGSIAFGGTKASAKTTSLTMLARYKLSDRFSIYGGPRIQSAEADFQLTGVIYGPLSGYTASLERDTGFGYVVGAAFEIPEYFLRVSLTYSSAITHDFNTTESSIFGRTVSQVSADTPQSVNLQFQSGIAPKTFIFGGARWAEWSALRFEPPVLAGASPDPLVDFKDTWSYVLGVGRQFSDDWSGTLAVLYEPSTNPRPTPLTPADGFRGIALGAIYTGKPLEMHFNAAFTELGDTKPFVNALGTTVSTFEDNRSVAIGMKAVYRF